MVATLSAPGAAPSVGSLLRTWRQRRRLSQMDLANSAAVSARHLSFVETGRSKPSPELVMHLAERLDVPLRDRNALLLAAGYAPRYAQTPLDDAAMEPVRAALDALVAGHRPFPAIVVDRHHDLVATNDAALDLLTDGVRPDLLAAPVNALRVSLHPEGLAPRIVNFPVWARHLVDGLRREVDVTADPVLADLLAEVAAYPGVPSAAGDAHDAHDGDDLAGRLFVPLVLRSAGGRDLAFFSTIATFGTACDITVEELSIESFFPADAATAAALGVDPGADRGVGAG